MANHLLTGAVLALGTIALSACNGAAANVPSISGGNQMTQSIEAANVARANVIKNPGFETGKLAPWLTVGKAPGEGVVTSTIAYTGKYSAFMGTLKAPAVSGLHGISQRVTIPAKGTLTWWYQGATNDSIQYADDEVDLTDSTGKLVFQCFKELVNTTTWTQGSCDVSKYAGKTLDVVFGVNDNGYSKTFINWYVDAVSLTKGA